MDEHEREPSTDQPNVNGGGVNFGQDNDINVKGDIIAGDKVMGDKIVTIVQQSQRYQRDALHQLRAITDTFTGRAKEIEAILAHTRTSREGAITIASATANIAGMSGVGKTELANLIGHLLVADYPDAQLLIELGAHSATPRAPADVLQSLLVQFYPTDRLPDDESALQALYRNTLSGKRAVVILDDCGSEADAKALLPPAGCVTLITSRQNLAIGERLKLGVLPRTESVALLRRYRAALTDAQADELAALCADLPIALSVAGSLLSVYESLLADVFIASLKADRVGGLTHGDQSVGRVFEASYRRLTPELRKVWRSLSIMPADFDFHAAFTIARFDPATAPSPIDELVRLALIKYEHLTKRFSWHDLLREFAYEKLPEKELQVVTKRFVKHYTDILNQIVSLVSSDVKSLDKGLSLFHAETQNVYAAIQYSDQSTASQQQLSMAINAIALRSTATIVTHGLTKQVIQQLAQLRRDDH